MGLAASREEPPQHRSLNCRHPCVAEFVNDTPLTVQTVWLDYSGGERRYYTLAPGARVRQPTFSAHPWRFAAPDERDAVCVVDDQAVWYPPPPPAATQQQEQQQEQQGGAGSGASARVARIRLARPLPWSPEQHPLFPPEWHGVVAALLLCHHRLAVQGSGCSPAAARKEQQQDWCLPGLLAAAGAGLRRLSSGMPASPSAAAAGVTSPLLAPLPANATHLGHLPRVSRTACTAEAELGLRWLWLQTAGRHAVPTTYHPSACLPAYPLACLPACLSAWHPHQNLSMTSPVQPPPSACRSYCWRCWPPPRPKCRTWSSLRCRTACRPASWARARRRCCSAARTPLAQLWSGSSGGAGLRAAGLHCLNDCACQLHDKYLRAAGARVVLYARTHPSCLTFPLLFACVATLNREGIG